MITYEEIKNDNYIKSMYDEIEEVTNKELWATHGWSHVLKVIDIVETVMKSLNYDEETIECGKIAGLLHDIGCINGKENHAVNGYDIANEYLSNKDISEKNKKMILDAIIDHSEGKNITSIVGAALIFADKVDYDKTRLTPLGYEIEHFNQIQHVESVDISIVDDTLIVKFVVNDLFDKDSLEKYYFTPKIFRAINNFSNYIKLKPCVKLNNEEWTLSI